MKERTLTPGEDRGLTDAQKTYLRANPDTVSLQPQMLAREALYKMRRHGAVTIDQAMELDAIRASCVSRYIEASKPMRQSAFDSYSDAEDSFIDRYGMSDGLN